MSLPKQTSPSAAADETGTPLANENDRPLRYMLLCHQRSGSNALDSVLKQHPDVESYGQLFNNTLEYLRYNRDMLGLPLYKPHPESWRHFGLNPPRKRRLELRLLNLTRRAHELDDFLSQFWTRMPRTATTKAIGFKLHGLQVSDAELLQIMNQHVDRVIILHRRNLLKSAVSWSYAVKTGIWVRRKDAPMPRISLSPDEVGWFIGKTRGQVAHWKDAAAQAKAPTRVFTFEDIIATDQSADVCRFLGVEPLGQKIRTKKLAGSDYAHIANASDLENRFASDRFGSLFN